MNNITTAGILLNAIQVPYKIFIKLCENYEPEELLKGRETFWEELGLNENHQIKLTDLLKSDWAKREFERVDNFGAVFITAQDLNYPAKLKDLKNPPIGLYIKGNANLSMPSAAIVGTRKCSVYGKSVATNLAKALVHKNITVISGGARGIDTEGHRGSLSENGITISVFGTGINKVYPAENKDLFSRITEKGALVSEFPMGTGGEAWRFSIRNRIIAAMSSRIIVVESSEDGGAMITARKGFELKREVWSVPGRITDSICKGSNVLLGEGAKVLASINDFIETINANMQINMNFDEFTGNDTGSSLNIKTPELNDEEKIVYSLLQRHGGRTIDEILIESGLDFINVQSALIELEADGLIINSSGRYSAAS